MDGYGCEHKAFDVLDEVVEGAEACFGGKECEKREGVAGGEQAIGKMKGDRMGRGRGELKRRFMGFGGGMVVCVVVMGVGDVFTRRRERNAGH